MHDIHRTLDALKASLELAALDLNADGQAELAFADGLVIHLTRIDEEALELSVRLPGLDAATPAMMRAMLGANLLGSSTDAGRLAIDVAKDEAVYCERWVVADLSEAAVQRRLAAFADTAAFWLTTGTDTIIEDTGRLDYGRTPTPVEAKPAGADAYVIRL